jgi:hypothetical protein
MSTPDSQQHQAAGNTSKRAKLAQVLPTDRIQFAKQLDIIRAYAAAYEKNNAPVSNAEVAGFVSMAETTVGMANAFLTDVGIILGDGGKFSASPALLEYFKVHQFSPDRAWAKLMPLFERSWFGLEIVPKLKIRPVDEAEAINDLAIAANAEKKHLGQLKVAIDWLVQVGLVLREGSQIRLGTGITGNGETPPPPKPPGDTPPPPPAPPADRLEDGLHKSVLPLDAASSRRLVVWAPATITAKELERIKQWLSVQIIVSDE